MVNVFGWMFVLSALAVIVSVIKPKLVMPWRQHPKRLEAIGLYMILAVIGFIGIGTVYDEDDVTQANTEETSEPEDAEPEWPTETTMDEFVIPALDEEIAAEEDDAELSEDEIRDALDVGPTPDELVEQHMPDSQEAFLQVMRTAAQDYAHAENELEESRIERRRREESQEYVDRGHFEGWVGRLERLGTNRDGHAHVTIRANGQVTFKTWNNALSDIGSDTLIEHGSPLYDALSEIPHGSAVRFSGRIIDEGSITEAGSVAAPEFIVRFDAVEDLH